jgi:predicted  nucleic acid-binding Zn-ribbon protein
MVEDINSEGPNAILRAGGKAVVNKAVEEREKKTLTGDKSIADMSFEELEAALPDAQLEVENLTSELAELQRRRDAALERLAGIRARLEAESRGA